MVTLANQKVKTLYYRRAQWASNPTDLSLEQHLINAHRKLSTLNDRIFEHRDRELRGLAVRERDNKGVFIHVSVSFPGQNTSCIPKESQELNVDVKTFPPPDGNDYMDGDIMLLVIDNHVCLCPSGATEASATLYIGYILEKYGFENASGLFSLNKIANVDKYNVIKEYGVATIELDSVLFDATLRYGDRKSLDNDLFKKIREVILDHFGKQSDDDIKTISAKENIDLKLIINCGKRERGAVTGNIMDRSAELVIDEDKDDVIIVAGNGARFKGSEIRISEKCKIEVRGKSVSAEKAWEVLESFYRKLKGGGVLSQ